MIDSTALWPTMMFAAIAQLGGHSERAVGAAGGLVHVGDLAGQPDPP